MSKFIWKKKFRSWIKTSCSCFCKKVPQISSKSPFKFLLPEYDNTLFCMLHTAFIILISHDSREPFPMRPTACRVSSSIFLVVFFFTPTQSTITVLFLDCTGKMNTAWNSSYSSLRSANGLAETPLLIRKPCYRQCSRVTIGKYHQCYVPCFSTCLITGNQSVIWEFVWSWNLIENNRRFSAENILKSK